MASVRRCAYWIAPSLALDFGALGFENDIASRLRAVLNKPHGIFLVTGPTGSGKTTTLYAALTELNRTEANILTIEDPIEYQLQESTRYR